MKNKCIISALFTVLILFTGCNQDRKVPASEIPKQNNQRQEEMVTSGGEEVLQMNEENNSEPISPACMQIDTEKVNHMIEELNVSESLREVMILDGENLLLQGKNRESEKTSIYVLCMKEGEENLRRTELNLVGEVECCIYEDCIVLYDTQNHIIILNHLLEIMDEITISEDIHSLQYFSSVRNYCVLPRDKKILYWKTVLENKEVYEGLYETNYACEEVQLVYKLEGPKTNLNYLNLLYKASPGYSQKGIFFVGGYFETIDTQSKNCVGYFDLESKESVVYKTNMSYMEISEAGAVYYDGYCLEEKEYSGKVLIIEESGKVSWAMPQYRKETEKVSRDLHGRMVTCYREASGECIFNLYKGDVWEKQVVVPYTVEKFFLLNQGQCILYSYWNQGGLRIILQDL